MSRERAKMMTRMDPRAQDLRANVGLSLRCFACLLENGGFDTTSRLCGSSRDEWTCFVTGKDDGLCQLELLE